MKNLRVAVIGAGYWGTNLIRNLHKLANCQVVAVADLNAANLARIKHIHPGIEPLLDAESVLNRSDIDAIVVATPPSTHYKLASKALEYGKHVLIEKPFTDSVETAERLIEAASSKGLTLMVDHTFVYSGPVRKIREMIDQRELGDIWYLDSIRIDLGLFNHDVNVVWDLAPHDISIMLHLIDAQPIKVSATGASPIAHSNGNLESIAYLTVYFADGCLGHAHLSWLSPVKMRRILIGGSKRMLVYDHLEPDHQVTVYDKGLDITTEENRRSVQVQRRTGDLYGPKIDQTEPLETMCDHFVNCAVNGTNPQTDGQSGLKVVKLIEAAVESLHNDGRVVLL